MFFAHFRALAFAAVCRNLRWRTLGFRLLRVVLSLAILPVFYNIRHLKDTGIDAAFLQRFGLPKKNAKALSSLLSGPEFQPIVLVCMDGLMILTILGVVLTMLVLFMQHVTAENESGLRQLLHIIGLSRYAYWISTITLEGFLQIMLDLTVLLLGARWGVKLRLVHETSIVVLMLAVALLVVSCTLTGCLFSFIMRQSKIASLATMMACMCLFVMALWSSGKARWSEQNLLAGEGRDWHLLCPVFPSFHILGLLIEACHKDHCLTTADIFGKLGKPGSEGLTIIFHKVTGGVKKGGTTPATEEVALLIEVVVLEVMLLLILLLVLDSWRLPAIRQGWSQAGMGVSPSARLETHELTHSYSWLPGTTRQRALDGVSFSMQPGATLGLLGPNGAGKTTTIRCITGEEKQQGGSIRYRPAAAAYIGETCIGLCSQQTVLIECLTVEEHLHFFARIKSVYTVGLLKSVSQMLEATQLGAKRTSFPKQLSGGMCRRLAIGCALIGNSDLSMLDEPSTGLDPISRRSIWALIGSVKDQGSCILLTTHMLEEAEELCSDIVILSKGKVAMSGSVQELKAERGSGYTLSVDTKVGESEQAQAYIASFLPPELQQPVKVTQAGQLVFKVGKDPEFVGKLFITFARGAEVNGIRHWGISQASLEDAYVRIVQSED